MSVTATRAPSRAMVVGASTLLVCAILTSFASSPLFPLYTDKWGLAPWEVSLAFVGYPVGVLAVVTLLGGLSDRIGRRATMLIGAGAIVVACVITASAWTLPVLITGRVLQGVASGLVTGTAAAALMDFHPRGPNAGSLTHAVCTASGMCVGPLMSGTLATYVPGPLVVPYVVIAVLVLAPTVFVLRAPGDRRVTGRTRIVRAIRVPRELWRPMSVAVAALLSLNGCTGLFGTFAARILTEGAGISSTGGTGGLLTVLIGMTVVSQLALNRISTTACVALGAPMIALGAATVALALQWTNAVATWGGAALIGFGGGLCLLGGTRIIGATAPLDRRAEMYAAWMVAAFVMLALTSLVSGLALTHAPLSVVFAVAALVFVGLAAYVVANARNLHGRLTQVSTTREAT